MARKKRKSSSKKGSKGSKGKPAILSLARKAAKRGAKTRVGKTSKGAARKVSSKSKPRGRRY